MANVLEVLASDDLNFLQELSDDLDEALSTISFDYIDSNYIRKKQEEIKKKYGERVKNFRIIKIELQYNSKLSMAIDNITTAYGVLQEIDPNNPNIEEIEDAIYEYLIFPDFISQKELDKHLKSAGFL
ncbi:MAG: hypothetical protein IB618_01355 [Candidatus Pacearchaeota archaeon]|nr:MAG: hypothetical protein IB618_01355 [Candidatus Pacearchaeota archaeon]